MSRFRREGRNHKGNKKRRVWQKNKNGIPAQNDRPSKYERIRDDEY